MKNSKIKIAKHDDNCIECEDCPAKIDADSKASHRWMTREGFLCLDCQQRTGIKH